jgi:hypothetical protein
MQCVVLREPAASDDDGGGQHRAGQRILPQTPPLQAGAEGMRKEELVEYPHGQGVNVPVNPLKVDLVALAVPLQEHTPFVRSRARPATS